MNSFASKALETDSQLEPFIKGDRNPKFDNNPILGPFLYLETKETYHG